MGYFKSMQEDAFMEYVKNCGLSLAEIIEAIRNFKRNREKEEKDKHQMSLQLPFPYIYG